MFAKNEMATNQKYVFFEGRFALNPNYISPEGISQKSILPQNASTLAIVSTIQDHDAMDQVVKSQMPQLELPIPQMFQDTIKTMQDQSYLTGFNALGIDGGILIDGLSKFFGQYEIPIGLMSKLTQLKGKIVHFKIDDSGSMTNDSNLSPNDASPYMKRNLDPRELLKPFLSRWEEAEDRMHTIMDVLAYVPTGPIVLSFFDRRNVPGVRIILERCKVPEEFLEYAHRAIHELFKHNPSGNTPILQNMQNMLNEANLDRKKTDKRTMHYLLSDGEPSGGAEEIRQIKDLLNSKNRCAADNPFTFLACSNDARDRRWMHEIEEIAPYVAALPDFKDEQAEVNRNQGSAFPYSRGFWILCNVAASINPYDLDALDQHAPLTKPTLENLMGRTLTKNEYAYYFKMHPNAERVFKPDYNLFCESQFANDIRSVKLFLSVLSQGMNQDIDEDDDDTEMLEVQRAEDAVLKSRRNNRALTLFAPRLNASDAQSNKNVCCVMF